MPPHARLIHCEIKIRFYHYSHTNINNNREYNYNFEQSWLKLFPSIKVSKYRYHYQHQYYHWLGHRSNPRKRELYRSVFWCNALLISVYRSIDCYIIIKVTYMVIQLELFQLFRLFLPHYTMFYTISSYIIPIQYICFDYFIHNTKSSPSTFWVNL